MNSRGKSDWNSIDVQSDKSLLAAMHLKTQSTEKIKSSQYSLKALVNIVVDRFKKK